MQKVKTVYIDPNKISKHTDKLSKFIHRLLFAPGNGVFLFAQLCVNGVGMGTKSTVTEWGWGRHTR